MSTPSRVAVCAALMVVGCATAQRAESPAPRLGQQLSAAELADYDISIPPSGEGLPAGSGTARAGLKVYEQHCLACHGAKGMGKPADALAGGIGSLATKTPLRTVGSYWPYSTTLFDYVRRAMPLNNPLSSPMTRCTR